MKWLLPGVVALLLCCPCQSAARDPGGRAEGGGGEQIPLSLRQWTQDVMLLQKEYDRYAFLGSNLNRTYAISRQLPPGEVERIAGAAEAVHSAVSKLAISWQNLGKAGIPSRYARAVTAWERKIDGVSAGMASAVCAYCDISATSPAGDVVVVATCAGKVAGDCATGECLDCCGNIPDAGLQRLCTARCRHQSSLCLLAAAIKRHSRAADGTARP